MRPYVLVSGDFVKTGGMDRANHALASYLADRGRDVHLIAYRASEELLAKPNVTLHRVPKLAGSYFLSEPLLDRLGRHWAAKMAAPAGRVVVNGGNCLSRDVNWVHYVHTAYLPRVREGGLRWLSRRLSHQIYVARERRMLGRARVVIANSQRTKRDLVERVGIPEQHVHTLYYGIDQALFRPAGPDERAALRDRLGWPADRVIVAFIGALGDLRKGFDTLFAAWTQLCRDPNWDADLIVVGTGADLVRWRKLASDTGLSSRIHFLGFRQDVPDLLKACDALVAPTRYEAYGLGVHEALACGLPALVSAGAGVAERYPAELADLLIPDPDDVGDLAERLRSWRAGHERYRRAVLRLSDTLRAETWDGMAEKMVRIMEAAA